jgi:hypothetical protein
VSGPAWDVDEGYLVNEEDQRGKAGRPIILDTDFTDPDPERDNYTKYGDDKFSASSPNNADTYAEGDDNGDGGRYFGPSLALHTLIKKAEEGQGESNPDLSSPSSPVHRDPEAWDPERFGGGGD